MHLFCLYCYKTKITLSISKMEKPPIKSADADPETWVASLSEALTATDTYGLMSFNPGIDRNRIKCSGEYGKKRQ